ncbi:MAG TPA: ATP-binding protein [Methylomirabilota bacterium]|nr:ATP-binding protein [Methylomirabilota bacterium]
MGETRVDLLHLLEDLRDAYPGSAEETILTEIVANSLDSGARSITFTADPASAALTIADDGRGMRRRDLARYHDVAATTKTRGEGIGFAGVGIKIGLLVSEEVLTETRLGRHHAATAWHLASRHRAPWKWVPPPGLVAEHGTAVRLRLKNPLSPLLDPGFIEGALWRHFQPLLDPDLADILAAHYPHGVRFIVNGRALEAARWEAPERAPLAARLPRKRRPSASGYLVRDRLPLGEERQGLAVSTFGKVIKRGWEWLGLAPSSPARIGGVIEVPALAQALTLSKADFVRTGPRGAVYLAYRKAIQEAAGHQLAQWGDLPEPGTEARRRAARPVERDLEAVLVDLAEEFPLLAALVERRAGGQRRLPVGRGPAGRELLETPAAVTAPPEVAQETPEVAAAGEPRVPEGPEAAPWVKEPEPPASAEVSLPAAHGPRRPGRYGLSIQFEERPDEPELARLVETTVWVNAAHPAYRRAVASRSEGYHIALATAMALAPLAVEPAKEHAFLSAFLSHWGGALERRQRRRRG